LVSDWLQEVNFLVDAHLPRRIARRLQEAGHDTCHTLDLPNGNQTPDAEINTISLREQGVVITKDADFVNSFSLKHEPYKLLLISTGNIKNADLETLLLTHLSSMVAAFAAYDFLDCLAPRSSSMHNS
jgi:predicted nuclease of predicted toxin-antitoxin system